MNAIKIRVLRFALAQTGLLDTDSLDLSQLSFSLGRNTSAQFSDVKIRLEVCCLGMVVNSNYSTDRVAETHCSITASTQHQALSCPCCFGAREHRRRPECHY